MNTQTIIRTTNAEWLRRGIAIVGALLISMAVVLGLANRAAITNTPAAPASSLNTAQQRYLALKDRQAEARDATFIPWSVYGSPAGERYAALKQRQAGQVMDAVTVSVPAPAASWVNTRYPALKDAQAELRDTTVVPAPAATSRRERFWEFKQRQAELREEGR